MKSQARTTVETYVIINNGVKTRQQMSDDLGLSYTKLVGIVSNLRKQGKIATLARGFRGHSFNKPSKLETL